jgi:hypothetical protein
MKVQYSRRARNDLRLIEDYLRQHAPEADIVHMRDQSRAPWAGEG